MFGNFEVLDINSYKQANGYKGIEKVQGLAGLSN